MRHPSVSYFQSVTLLTVLHHDGQEAHNDLGAGSDEDLAFPTLLSIVDAFQSICENVHAHHDACKEIYFFYRKTCMMQLLRTEYYVTPDNTEINSVHSDLEDSRHYRDRG